MYCIKVISDCKDATMNSYFDYTLACNINVRYKYPSFCSEKYLEARVK